jgi:hypothetical protein
MHHRGWLSVPLALSVVTITIVTFSQAAEASVGVGVQASPVRLGGVAHPGGNYALPPVYVVNTGTQAETITMRVERLGRGPDRLVPPAWIQFASSVTQLGPGSAARIPLELVVPSSARPGRYQSDIVVNGSAAPSAATANIGVAAATELEFSIQPGPLPGQPVSFPRWAWWIIAGLFLLAIAIIAVRRSGLRVRVERTTANRNKGSPGGRRG